MGFTKKQVDKLPNSSFSSVTSVVMSVLMSMVVSVGTYSMIDDVTLMFIDSRTMLHMSVVALIMAFWFQKTVRARVVGRPYKIA